MNHVIPKLYFILSWDWYLLLQDSRTYPSFGFRKPPVTLWRWLREPITLIALNFWDIESNNDLQIFYNTDGTSLGIFGMMPSPLQAT